ncbi:class I SAM-dependent methyltransferase [Rhodonellum sp.]|uniref:class I SAM-dependent methyltransferase n=1 Tax=Rhodonellum sp. TaxID=2231180 RepID=UPI00271CC1FE|nr:class I SAM-dependent methyltransferase [Rhodonellum sp.]MDO9551460.1 class I SAM-dependent methyltransferase [Rhodonellum sp.]
MIEKYKIEWISSIDSKNNQKLAQLSEKMSAYYTTNTVYYSDISDSEFLWTDSSYLTHRKILERARVSETILEIGCGESPILKFNPELMSKYSGIDFSPNIIANNQKRFKEATFKTIENPTEYNYPDGHFDLIFSVFVLEHTVYPKKFLDECIRMLKPGGEIIVLAPSYLDNGFLPSQQFAEGLKSGRELLKKGRLISALRAALYNKLLIPRMCKKLANKIPGFYININPLCFKTQEFKPDVDAVYVVSAKEIEMYMAENKFIQVDNEVDLNEFIRDRKLCFQIFKEIK